MIPELGQIVLILALLVAIVQGVVPLIGAHRGDPLLMGVAKPAHVLTPSSTFRRVLNMTALAAAQAGMSAAAKRG